MQFSDEIGVKGDDDGTDAFQTMSNRDLKNKKGDKMAQQKSMEDMAALAVKRQTGLLPVSKEELDLLAGISNAFQNAIFMRYQTRITAKFYTSFLFIVIPFVSSATPTIYLPGYENPFSQTVWEGIEDVKNNKPSLIIAALTFLASDCFEWVVINLGILYRRTRNVHNKVDLYRQLITKEPKVVFLFVSFAVVFGAFMFWAMFQGYAAPKLKKNVVPISIKKIHLKSNHKK